MEEIFRIKAKRTRTLKEERGIAIIDVSLCERNARQSSNNRSDRINERAGKT